MAERVLQGIGRPDEVLGMLAAAGLNGICEVERTWPGPVRLLAGRRQER